ncbi:AbiJ-related protein [Vibrio metschnikovii]|uniref:AAA family ATPase n=3 Tax=Unclassified Bacteria TaxID=49928 RepID=A0AAU6TH02_UNCXX|nr:AAA family ATPase [Vibrio metschnikovii]EKO3588456.1 AAA family ATPase [Vibrio metschnikovii]EKO3641270.1 AAA family ATPase [Vibrio metschnikovii]EKO3717916.1 AAA family ATPase [Vibrio metschnikovii]EKO3736511.1 AAA family ATPase [Vibrio metschnikovii]EKO3746435.1 AAA family ATPase [Vibrio metschnikovii]
MISTSNRELIIELLLNTKGTFEFSKNYDDGIIPFLNEIWDLRTMPSEDRRFNNAEQDVIQHTINNDDWDLKYLFIDRLKLLENDEKFTKFLETFLLPKFQSDPTDVFHLTEKINEILETDKLTLAIISYDGDFPVLELNKLDVLERPSDIPINKIPFYSLPYHQIPLYKSIKEINVDSDKPKCHFILVADNWDDFYHKTKFCLVYFDNGNKHIIGEVKIGNSQNIKTIDELPSEFFSLNENFVSLGQSEDYYKNLSTLFGNMITSVLYSLKDAAFFSEISDEYENLDLFKKSLIREDSAERMHRIAKPMIHGVDLENLYSFKYNFHPKYADTSVPVTFNFSADKCLPQRMIALIGKNGSGKTQLLTSLPLDIANKNSNALLPHIPVYSKVIAVSYSTFDNFTLPKKTSDFNYVYCGLRDEQGNVRSKKGQLQKFHNTWKKIEKQKRLDKWKKVISNFLDIELIELFIKSTPEEPEKLYFDRVGFSEARNSFSSGQSIVLFVISEIVANIRLDSLLLFDEPETHLHPNAISQLMNGIAELVSEFESYCIIATHSPIIIQEMFSRDVLVISREENIPSIKNIGIESFGENLSIITEEVFGNRTIPKFYERTIKHLVKRFKTYDRVLEIMKNGNLPLSLNVRLYLQNLVDNDAKN